jgi:diguanylate cyclase (GGDEF)-like protein
VQPAGSERRHSTLKLFATFAAIMLVPVVLLGLVLAASYRTEEDQRGLAQGRSEALLMAQTAVEPVLDGRPLSQGLVPSETADMDRLVRTAVHSGNVLRLRLRDLSGEIVYSDDGSGLHETSAGDHDQEAVAAAHGIVQARVTHLNADSTDDGPLGPASVEIYLPLATGTPSHRVGVLEVYLPYAPIRADVNAGVDSLYRNLAVGLGLLYLVLFGISFTVGRRLRRQVKLTAYMAEHDALTDLPNRTLFHRRVAAELTRGRRRGRPTTIAIIDLDRFKEINDTLGHHNGDRLLAALSTRMAAHLRGLDSLARLGGDEFGILLAEVGEPEEILLRLRDVIEHEISVAGLPISVEASIGYVVAPEHGNDVDELLQLADVAMYVAKAQHLGVIRYDPSQNHYDAANLTLMSELRHAIESNQLVLHYQPKVGIDSGGIEAVEALVRWNHPGLGLLYPDRFIPQVEQTDLIDRLTEWVVRRALEDLTHFGPDAEHMTVAVNVSARNLGRAGFAGKIVAMLDEVGVSAERLYIEVTETALMTDPTRAATVLAELNTAGLRVSIDDFGTGQTSLSYLSTLPIGELKIDRSFIADMIDEPGHAAIVHSIAELGHSLGFRVVGEGIETREVLDALAASGCDVAQGYYFARPMPAEKLVRWLAEQREQSASQLTR